MEGGSSDLLMRVPCTFLSLPKLERCCMTKLGGYPVPDDFLGMAAHLPALNCDTGGRFRSLPINRTDVFTRSAGLRSWRKFSEQRMSQKPLHASPWRIYGLRVIPDFYTGELRRILYRYETMVSKSDVAFVWNRDIGISHCQIGNSN
jgi:hypothetical protein